jgi:hypothetical protein
MSALHIYVLSNEHPPYKVGIHTGKKSCLISRYITALPRLQIHMLEECEVARDVEQIVLQTFQTKRIMNVNMRMSEWIDAELDDILCCVLHAITLAREATGLIRPTSVLGSAAIASAAPAALAASAAPAAPAAPAASAAPTALAASAAPIMPAAPAAPIMPAAPAAPAAPIMPAAAPIVPAIADPDIAALAALTAMLTLDNDAVDNSVADNDVYYDAHEW